MLSLRRARRVLTVTATVIVLGATLAGAEPITREPGPAAGWDVFARKGCGACHSVGSAGTAVTRDGLARDDLARTRSGAGFFELGAALWNHVPLMASRVSEAGAERPRFMPSELASLFALVFTVRVYGQAGDPGRGRAIFESRGCAGCHAVGAAATSRGPRLDTPGRNVSAADFAGVVSSHRPAPAMPEVPLARLGRQEMVDVAAYVYTLHYFDPTTGDVGRGRVLAERKGCLRCHPVNGRGPRIGPDLAVANVTDSPAAQVAVMWNHGRYMETESRRRAMILPTLAGGELADIATYLAALAGGAPRPR